MRILLDLQGAQTAGSRHRGIGRYSLSLAEGILRERGEHEVRILLNGAFPESIPDIRKRLSGLLDESCFHIFHPVTPTRQAVKENAGRRRASELIREAAIAALDPDAVHVTSHFEGYGDNFVSTFHELPSKAIQSATLYDLIPYINQETYLSHPVPRRWYEERLLQIRRADLLLAISESSAREAVDYLGFSPDKVVGVGTAADPHFVAKKISKQRSADLRDKYGLASRFVMYTGGIDHRKNIERLISAFGKLPHSRSGVSLAIVCSCSDEHRELLERLCAETGLGGNEVVLTGFVPEDDLLDLYNLCELFVFPSWHEGFGLPVLEAMHCGAPVIASDRSSLPEVVGLEEALFDPFDEDAIREKLDLALTNKAFRSTLLSNSRQQTKKFSWKLTAQKAIAALEQAFEKRQSEPARRRQLVRPRLAYVSPIPPARSGIADFGAELLPELSRHYQIDLIVPSARHVEAADEKLKNEFRVRDATSFLGASSEYERVLYHFGNSDHHGHMFELLKIVPGVVVLHDFYLSGMFNCLQNDYRLGPIFNEALFDSHGFQPLIDLSRNPSFEPIIWKYPANRQVVERALGIIVHSEYARRLASQWLGDDAGRHWSVVPLLRARATSLHRADARARLAVGNEFLICSFGGIGETKDSDRLLDAYLNSNACRSGRARLVFVGSMPENEFGERLRARLVEIEGRASVTVTGWVTADDYKAYLQAADAAVQLRSMNRGETSAAVLDCLNYGIPTIVNANGSMADLPNDAVLKLEDKYAEVQLSRAIDRLFKNEELASRLANCGRAFVKDRHDPRRCAEEYRDAIEHAYERSTTSPIIVAGLIGAAVENLDADNLSQCARLLEPLFAQRTSRTIYVDIGRIEDALGPAGIDTAIRRAAEPLLASGSRFEVVSVREDGNYTTRRKEALRALGVTRISLGEHVGRLSSHDQLKVLAVRAPEDEFLQAFSNMLVDTDVVLMECPADESANAIPEFQ
jgi:glycosyltransferase involved in cell wall biosynthesis